MTPYRRAPARLTARRLSLGRECARQGIGYRHDAPRQRGASLSIVPQATSVSPPSMVMVWPVMKVFCIRKR